MEIKKVKFGLFSDLHYHERHHTASVNHIDEIMAYANNSGVDFVMQLGDFSSNWKGSPEAIKAYIENPYGLAVYGIYGNHDLQSAGNSTETVTPYLNNREVIWGTSDTKMNAQGDIAYYWFDANGIRMICLDTNYSYSPERDRWEHNLPNSYALSKGNIKEHSLGKTQIQWLEDILEDAAKKEIHCIVCSHASFMDCPYGTSPDKDEIRRIFNNANQKRKGTVLAAFNGHRHATTVKISDGIFFYDMNVAINGAWSSTKIPHYTDEQTFDYVEHDDDGNITARYQKKLNELWQANCSWYFKAPLYTVVTVSTDGKITVEPRETDWIYGVEPPFKHDGIQTRVKGGEFNINL